MDSPVFGEQTNSKDAQLGKLEPLAYLEAESQFKSSTCCNRRSAYQSSNEETYRQFLFIANHPSNLAGVIPRRVYPAEMLFVALQYGDGFHAKETQ